MIEILVAFGFKPIKRERSREKYMCGAVHVSNGDLDSSEALQKVFDRCVMGIGFDSLTSYLSNLPGLPKPACLTLEEFVNFVKSRDHETFYHPVIFGSYDNIRNIKDEGAYQEVKHEDFELASKFLTSVYDSAGASSLFVAPTLNDINRYTIMCSNFVHEDMWICSDWEWGD